MSPRLVFATHNEHKVIEVAEIFSGHLDLPQGAMVSAGALGAPEPVETGLTFAENALIKARALVAFTGLPAIADDSGICVKALGGAPGVFSARWCGHHGDDQANLDLLIAQMTDVPDPGRAAWFECAAVLVTPDGHETVQTGTLPGTLGHTARGQRGFGYDPILIPDGETRTCAELDPEEKNAISHRGRAFRALAPAVAAVLTAQAG
ncbi:MAG: RdgB/HAM1 family non-canonical purine NTP pyrophosphatase [Bifidobacteriaceae bacterium]|jgi:XTP/dITP diphosphohydrolase|nr:RdgB/HAM1 family non-canonical purine NTP pyrophosphatase [Bifidobacteriaceae bacterium]